MTPTAIAAAAYVAALAFFLTSACGDSPTTNRAPAAAALASSAYVTP